MGSFFQPWGQYKAIKFSTYSKLGADRKYLFYFSLDPSVKPLGPNSTFAPIGMFDLG
jgi:hypothetical protein